MQVEGAVRLRTVQEDGHAGDRDVRHDEGERYVTPPRQVDETVCRDAEQIVSH